jgi:regulator of protease activity HflC (stomatin/prohibitin superfamily)
MDEQEGFFQRPVVKTLLRFGVFILVYLVLLAWQFFAPPGINYFSPVFDLFICVIGALLWMVFFAQFVLPANNIKARLSIVDRLISYLVGYHGPAIFVENGVVRVSEGELKKRGPGVVWLDSASAAVLRTAVKFTRTIGPGVHFTRGKEYIAATVDLHSQIQAIGPNDDDQPFSVNRDDPNYEHIQQRRYETSALTRDAIEVVATIAVTFRIKSTPGEGKTPFGFNEENVRRAVTESLTQGAQTDQPLWSQLPARMAVDVWREYLRKFKLIQLFEIPDGRSETSLQMIGGLLKKRLSQETVEVLDDFGRPMPDVAPLPSHEFERLREMGLEVTSAVVRRLTFAPEVQDKLIGQWTTLWLKNAQKERDQVERNRKLLEANAQEEALKEFAINASQEISQVKPAEVSPKTHALEMLVHSTFLGIRRNTSLLKRTSTEQLELAEIFRWLREKRGEVDNDLG